MYVVSSIILMIFISILSNKLIREILKEQRIKAISNRIENSLKNEKGYFNYERIKKYLKKNGQPYNISPVGFIIAKLGFALLGIVVGIEKFNLIIAIILGIGMFFLLDLLINIANKEDDEKIIMDLSDIYDCLRIQNKGGVFIAESLQECYLIAKSKRLKKALLELNNQITLTRDLAGALDEFNSKFNNIYIDTFVMTLQQSLQTGQSEKAFEDISEALKETATVVEARRAGKIERKIDLLKIAIFIFLLLTIVFGMFMEFQRELLIF